MTKICEINVLEKTEKAMSELMDELAITEYDTLIFLLIKKFKED